MIYKVTQNEERLSSSSSSSSSSNQCVSIQQKKKKKKVEEETGQLLPHMQLTGATLVQIFAALCHLSFFFFFLLPSRRRGGPLGIYLGAQGSVV